LSNHEKPVSGWRYCDSTTQSFDLSDRPEVGGVWEGFWSVGGVAVDFEAAEDAAGFGDKDSAEV